MLQKIISYITQMNMICAGDRIVAGISGGADSVCLFYVLLELRKEIPFEFCVVHVNHGIREAAGEDEAYVSEICSENGIPFYCVKKNVPEIACRLRIGEEEAGRKVRYEAFTQVLEQVYGGDGKIAVAHTQNDRAETLLFHLFRGTGLSGLTGIAPVRQRVIRPLLCVNRSEIEAWLEKRRIGYRTDLTNDSDAYARNRIRHHILPYAEQELCHGVIEHINKTADLLDQAARYLNGQTQQAFAHTALCEGDEIRFDKEAWEKQDPYLRRSMVHEAFRRLTPAAKDITSLHVEQVCGLFEKQVGKKINLPYHILAVRNYEGVVLTKRTGTHKEEQAISAMLTGPEGEISFAKYHISWRVFENTKGERILSEIPKNDFTKWFDYDKINQSIGFRYRKTADVLTVNSRGGTKTVKEYMINEKIPAQERGRIPLLAEENRILWIVGFRISEYYKISSQTKKIIEIQISGGK